MHVPCMADIVPGSLSREEEAQRTDAPESFDSPIRMVGRHRTGLLAFRFLRFEPVTGGYMLNLTVRRSLCIVHLHLSVNLLRARI